MAKADPHDMRSAPYHQFNPTTCFCDEVFCLSCCWGCPRCQLGTGLDRRVSQRAASPEITVRLLSNGPDETLPSL